MQIIENVASGVTVVFDEDIIVNGNIEENANITVRNGSLTVQGNVCSGAGISLESAGEAAVFSASSFFSGRQVASFSMSATSQGNGLQVNGFVGERASITLTTENLTINGPVGEGVRMTTQTGNIRAGDIGAGSKLTTQTGNIRAGDIGAGSKLTTQTGNIRAGDIGADSKLTTRTGNIEARTVGPKATLETNMGTVKTVLADPSATLTGSLVNGVSQSFTESSAHNSSSSFSFNGAGGVNISVNNVSGANVRMGNVRINGVNSAAAGGGRLSVFANNISGNSEVVINGVRLRPPQSTTPRNL